ncbi:MAG: TonB-dependent receptor [Acidobacteriaceae bacterium]|jgi:hypothetical protein|nr:TonB-dependent receptor [Acidobacteriaceae bacterium]
MGWLAAVAFVLVCPHSVRAQAQTPSPDQGNKGSILVTVTTDSGSLRLPGATVRIAGVDDRAITAQVSDGEGLVSVDALAPGVYRLSALLDGFREVKATAKVEAGKAAQVSLDLPLAGLTAEVNVIGNAETAPPTIGAGLSTKGVLESRVVEQLPIRDNSVLSALKLLAGIVDGPGGVSIKGGRANQSGLQIGMTTQTDPSTGMPLFHLPADAIDTVEVLPNPYAVEFGRFSSGLTVINTKRGGNTWNVALNSPDISLRTERGQPWHPIGFESFGPRIGFGGPLIKNKLFLEQSAQVRYELSEVWSRPPNEVRSSKWVSSFTRLDANVWPKLALVGNINVFRSAADDVTLNTFNGPDVTPNEQDRLISGNIAAHSTLTDKIVLESTLQVTGLAVNVAGHGSAPMLLIPSENSGNFFNSQHRSTTTLQWVEAMTGSYDWGHVTHLFKAGLDVMQSSLTGTSTSGPVSILRDDGTLARTLTFAGPASQSLSSTDVALFAQDRVQPFDRLLLEFGGRIDRDGVFNRTNATPRVGAIFIVGPKRSGAIHAGYGLFFERTPSIVGAFDQLEVSTEQRFAPDGVTSLGAPLSFLHTTAPNLDVARSATWNVQFDQRLPHGMSFRVAALERRGSNEPIVTPIVTAQPAAAQLVLSSDGRSLYREGEVTFRYAPSKQFEIGGTYVHSTASADLNAYTSFFGNIQWPVIGANQYAPTPSAVPNRLIMNTRTIFWNRVLVSSILELHSGFPYSATNDMLDWVGPRNQQFYFPTFAMLDLDVEHRFTFIKGKPWIGLRAFNALNRFSPTEVQSNLSSPSFGSLYNSYGRQIRLQLRFE